MVQCYSISCCYHHYHPRHVWVTTAAILLLSGMVGYCVTASALERNHQSVPRLEMQQPQQQIEEGLTKVQESDLLLVEVDQETFGSIETCTNANRSPNGISCDAMIDNAWSQVNVDKTVTLWDLSLEEMSKLVELGKRLQDLIYHKNKPSDVVRFLIQRKFDLDAAELMFRNMVKWRLENRVDSILHEYTPPAELIAHFPGAVMKGLDKDGDPVVVCRSGITDGGGLLKHYGKQEMIRHAIWEREHIWNGDWVREYEAETQKPLKQLTIIDDMAKLQLAKTIFNKRLLEAFGEVVQLDRNNYPQSVKRFMVIRVPRIFETVWNMVRVMLDPLAVEKTFFSSPKLYIDELAKYLDIEILPEEIAPGLGKGEVRDGFPPSFRGGPFVVPSSKES